VKIYVRIQFFLMGWRASPLGLTHFFI